MRRLGLSQRLSIAFAVLLLACCGASLWLQMRAGERHAQVVIQRLSGGLAAQIAGSATLMDPQGLNQAAVRELFGKLMDVNPSVEVYLLAADGRIVAHDAPDGRLQRSQVDLAPVRALLGGAALPVAGDDPRSAQGRKVFSAAPLTANGRTVGYVYVVLLGEAHQALAQRVEGDGVLQQTLGAMALVTALGLVAGWLAFRWITRPLRDLTAEVQRIEAAGPGATLAPPAGAPGADEIARLRAAFAQMTGRLAEQWRELSGQDQQRRELVANISHDLRTPLTSLHGYLETLRLKGERLAPAERERYLDVALGQSLKVNRLAQELFELARLEYGVVKPEREPLALADLVQDVFQKFELAAEARRQRLVADIAPGLPVVQADVALIERVLTNLLDNAIRHSPQGGEIEVQLRRDGGGVAVQVSDSGPGIPEAWHRQLFTRPTFGQGPRGQPGGLGLVIVRRILLLHGSEIRLVPQPGRGAVFRFALPAGG